MLCTVPTIALETVELENYKQIVQIPRLNNKFYGDEGCLPKTLISYILLLLRYTKDIILKTCSLIKNEPHQSIMPDDMYVNDSYHHCGV